MSSLPELTPITSARGHAIGIADRTYPSRLVNPLQVTEKRLAEWRLPKATSMTAVPDITSLSRAAVDRSRYKTLDFTQV